MQAGLRAAWSSPILSHDGMVLGTFGIYYREVRSPTPVEIKLIDDASRIAGIAIERERSQTALQVAFAETKHSEEQLQQIVDAIPQTVVLLRPDGSVLYANRTVLDYIGVSADEVAESDFRLRVLHPEDMEKLDEIRRNGFSGAAPWENEVRVWRKDGVYRWFLIQYNPLLINKVAFFVGVQPGRILKIASGAKRGCEKRISCFGKRSTVLPCTKKSWARPRNYAGSCHKSARWPGRIPRF